MLDACMQDHHVVKHVVFFLPSSPMSKSNFDHPVLSNGIEHPCQCDNTEPHRELV